MRFRQVLSNVYEWSEPASNLFCFTNKILSFYTFSFLGYVEYILRALIKKSQKMYKLFNYQWIFLITVLLLLKAVFTLREGECEVCVKTVEKFAATLADDVKKDPKLIETAFKKFCKGSKNKENRFCYYLGGLEESATGILGELSKPLSWSMPADKICEKLRKKDAQICDLRFDKQIDLNNVDLKKLKVRDLKKILNDWDEGCDGCIEKTDFIKRIEELKPQYMGRSEL